MNRLAREHSPYLRQHAANPVEWYPWGTEAFEAARLGDKPIFLSIGYSTCHWCHVMAHESFERQAVADVLNRDFVCIKVDREERPDVDRVYMLFVQATTGSGGWPMSVWLTPDLKPFHGGTYYPPESRGGRPGFLDVLAEITRVWKADRAGIAASADGILARLKTSLEIDAAGTAPGPEALTAAVAQYSAAFDRARGGFGGAPKFPRPTELLFLLGESGRTGDTAAREMAKATLDAMACGGIRDHVGGGFHRYSVDAAWRVPHFEKMLYDQAQLALAYIEAFDATSEPRFAEIAEETLDYVVREMTAPEGGFYSAEDADSLPLEQAGSADAHKAEGAFYLWGFDELGALLGADADLVRAYFGVEKDGNAPFDPQDEFGTGNLLYQARGIDDLAAAFGLPVEEVGARLSSARRRMFDARAKRPRPHRDEKVLTAWNGMMIAALARAGMVRGRSDYLDAAERAATFMRTRMWRESDGVLFRRCGDGDVAVEGFAEDYAGAVWGALALGEAIDNGEWLDWALALQRRQDERFLDEQGSAWYSTTGADPSILLRLREDYDGAEPSATAVTVRNLLTIGRLSRNPDWGARVEKVLAASAVRLTRAPRAVPMMLANLAAYLTR